MPPRGPAEDRHASFLKAHITRGEDWIALRVSPTPTWYVVGSITDFSSALAGRWLDVLGVLWAYPSRSFCMETILKFKKALARRGRGFMGVFERSFMIESVSTPNGLWLGPGGVL